MDILYLLIPLSAVLILCILGVFAWALHGGQFDDLECEGERIFAEERPQAVAWRPPPEGVEELGSGPSFPQESQNVDAHQDPR